MYELEKTPEVEQLIKVTKSSSGISGPDLVRAHIRLGEIMGKRMELNPSDTTIIAMMRGGIFFAQGIYMALGCRFMTYDPKNEKFVKPDSDHIVLVDSVINTGRTIEEILTPEMKIACCVINEKAVHLFHEQLYTVRVSKNSFVGADIRKQCGNAGPDTTMRLFNQI